MPHEVEVPKLRSLVFPDCCVVCDADAPGHTTPMTAGPTANKPLREPLGRAWSADVPVCAAHVGALLWSRRVGRLLFAVGVAVSAMAVLAMVELAPGASGWASWLVLSAAVAIPLYLVSRAYTPIFGIAAWDDRLIFAFRSRAYAESFAALNEAKLR